MTGCPNGCARPYLAEIGLVGKGPGRYNLYLGAAFDGSRLNKLYREDLDHAGIVAALDPLFAAYADRRQTGERFGAFAIRAVALLQEFRPVDGVGPEFLFDAQQLIVLGDAVGAAGRTGLNLAGVGGHHQVRNEGIFGLAGAM